MSSMPIASVANECFMLTVHLALSLPACYPTTCAPCYITAQPSAMTFPEFIGISQETFTLDVIPHLTQAPNGSIFTMYETMRMNESSATDTELREEYTWTENGLTL
jgi:hypothetical protein